MLYKLLQLVFFFIFTVERQHVSLVKQVYWRYDLPASHSVSYSAVVSEAKLVADCC